LRKDWLCLLNGGSGGWPGHLRVKLNVVSVKCTENTILRTSKINRKVAGVVLDGFDLTTRVLGFDYIKLMLNELTHKSKETRQKRVKDFFFTHLFKEDKELVQQNLNDLIQVKSRIQAQLQSLYHSMSHEKPQNPLTQILSKLKNRSLTPASFNSMSLNYGLHKTELNNIIKYFGEHSLFKLISPEGFPYLESNSPLNDTQKSDLQTLDYVILPIFGKNGFSVLCIDNEKKTLEYYSVDQSEFEYVCQVVENRLKELNKCELYDWNFMKVPGLVSDSSHILGLLSCLSQNFRLSEIKHSEFFPRLFEDLNQYLHPNPSLNFS